MSKNIDLTQFDSSDTTAVMEVTHPDDEDQKLGPTLTLAGMDSEIYRRTQARIARRRIESLAGRKKRSDDFDDTLELVVACTVAWDGFTLDNKVRKCDDANKREVYNRLPWLKDQASLFIHDRANYFRGADDGPLLEGEASPVA